MNYDFHSIDKIISENDIIECSTDGELKRGSAFLEIIQEWLRYSHNRLESDADEYSIKCLSLDPKEGLLLEVNLLQPDQAKGWQKLQLRLKTSVEACLVEPEREELESPLDDIRQSIQTETEN